MRYSRHHDCTRRHRTNRSAPPEEQAKVIDFLEEVKAAQAVRTMKSETFEESSKRVFDRHAELMQKLSR